MVKRTTGVWITVAILAAAVICLVLWQNKQNMDIKQLEELSYYDQFLFAEGTDVPAVLAEATAPEHQTEEASEDFYGYDPAVLAPYLPNCAEMESVVVNGGLVFVSYRPVQPEECTSVSLICSQGQVIGVTAVWGEGELYSQADFETGTVQLYDDTD